MRKLVAAMLISLAVAGCANVGADERGWTGNGAQPFDNALSSCQTETQATEGAQLEACMASKGWTRPQR